MYQILAYGANNAAGATLVDTPIVPDENFVPQNGHWFFTEQYQLMAKAVIGASITAAQLFDSTWNAINVPQIFPVNLAATPPSNPQVQDHRMNPISIPMNEQIALQLSNDLGSGNEYEFGLLWVKPQAQQIQVPQPGVALGNMARVTALITVTATLVAGAWTQDNVITIPNQIKGGTYCMLGLQLIVPNGIAYRLNFARAPLYQQRKLCPGNMTMTNYGDIPQRQNPWWLGPMGYFDTVELPLLAILGAAATASTTYVGYADLLFIGPQTMGQGQQMMSA